MTQIKGLTPILSLACALFMPSVAFSHADHGEPLNEDQALEQAVKYTGMIVDRPDAIEGVVLSERSSSTRGVYEVQYCG
ncbi:MAG: hypothetical protein ACJAXW_003451 [Candidatus Azotimanducaceae bacterium]|jgi:hypothetical protein